MADTTFTDVLPALKAVDLGDGTFAVAIAPLRGLPIPLADDASYTLPAGPGCAMILWGDADMAIVHWTSAGVVTLLTAMDPTPLTVTTNTDGKFCVFQSGGNAIMRNRSGAPITAYLSRLGA